MKDHCGRTWFFSNILHPDVPMTDEERAYQMWAVHPRDQDRFGFKNREEYFLAHIRAAKKDGKKYNVRTRTTGEFDLHVTVYETFVQDGVEDETDVMEFEGADAVEQARAYIRAHDGVLGEIT